MALKLYDLAGADPERRFSPYCWRVKMALAHKGLPVETIPWRFTEKDVIAFSGQTLVPVLVDGDTVVSDSWAIATYLEDRYPDRPSLFGGESARAVTLFVKAWADQTLVGAIAKLIVTDILHCLDEKDKDYFRTSREKRFGAALETITANRDEDVIVLRRSLGPLRTTLTAQPYLGGDTPNFADYAVFGCFQWARCTSPFPLLEKDDPVWAWRQRFLAAFDGLADKAVAYAA